MNHKLNPDPRCEQSSDCKAVGGALCRACQMRSRIMAILSDPKSKRSLCERQKKAWADPAKRAAESERQKKAWADPAKRAARVTGIKKAWADPAKRAARVTGIKKAWADPAKRAARDILGPEQLAEIAKAVSTTSRSYLDIAMDWLISPGRVGSIAKEFGVQRRGRACSAGATT